ncbi:putative nucleotidyltransferase [Limihaloglobus sulfuriphilus]|uniref:Putative nucleotidyltransferase n=1 Tax=Limihaloglobus sulfuriphilus TaxID=1851148 RepID=A0A1Q2MII0_9BACT|nr:nucleotidyltransferase family protein [Limihaloglobus sulfuriphilus]AQQ72107.1 putative nucleotidyltransferase [Limihaloglobus sulfuriphilus]
MASLEKIKEKRDQIYKSAKVHKIDNIRVFGSYARNEASDDSDIDLLVTLQPDGSLLDRIGFMNDVKELLGVEVDVVNENALYSLIKENVLKEAVPL